MNLRRQGNKSDIDHKEDQKMSHLMIQQLSWPGRFRILLKFEQARDFHIFFICFLSIFDKMTLTF